MTARWTSAALVALALLALAPAAHAYRIAGRPWPGPTITYHNTVPAYDHAVRRAARAWNRASVGILFRAASRDDAQVVLVGTQALGVCGGAVRGAGWFGQSGPGGRYGPQRGVFLAPECPVEGVRRLTVAHELGHVLGLGHETRRCALMNPVHTRGGGTKCSQSPAAVRRRYRRLLEPDDVRGARRLYR
jgi:hypothetical protein